MQIRLDDTGFGGIEIYQDPELFCYGVDAVLLSDFAAGSLMSKKHSSLKIMDLCTGNGIVPLILSHKTDSMEICAIELQARCCELARKSIEHNALSSKINVMNADIADLLADDSDKRFDNYFDAVTCNPPYTKMGDGITDSTSKSLARHESSAGIYEFTAYAYRILKDKGSLYLVHRPSRLVDIFDAGRSIGMEPKKLQFISGKKGSAPNIALIELSKNGGRELKVLPEIYTREEDGSFSEDLLAIYEK